MSTLILPTPVKSTTDEKNYRVIKLANGLVALLISDQRKDLKVLDDEEKALDLTKTSNDEDEDAEMEDGSGEESCGDEEDGDDDEHEEPEPKADEEEDALAKKASTSGLKKSAAGLCVAMGSFSDPVELPGLAHFLEHMVFMGSTKYPDENAFDKFVQKHGGTDNAHTDCENTVFYFESQRKHFRECLDRFAQFFISPLLKSEAMQREREAVDSEYQMALPNDFTRKQQIFGSLANPGHPMGKFFWGNLESLQLAKYEDAKVHEMLCSFKDRHYCAKSMTLTIQSQHDLDTLQGWIEESFSDVPNNEFAHETFGHLTDPFKNANFNKIYKVSPIQNVYQLDMNWILPPLLDKYREKPLHYLSWIIGHEGKGSLISYLRKNVWALNLTAGNQGDGFEFNSTCSIFSVNIILTKSGHENVRKVMDAVFSYLKMLRKHGPEERIYREIQKIESLSFDYGEEMQPMEMVETACTDMLHYPPELYLTGNHLMFDYNPDLLRDCANQLNEDGVNIFIMAREYKDLCSKVEPWFRTNYIDEEIPKEWKEHWKNIEVYPELFLPEPNRFIAEDTSLKPPTPDPQPYPVRIIDDPDGELFYRKDEIFKQPRALIYMHLCSSLVSESIENAVCLDLMVGCMAQQMIEDVYPAEMAQLDSSFFAGERGIILKMNGLNDKLPLLLETIFQHFSVFETRLTDDMFKAVRDQIKKNYYNSFIKPMKLVRELRLFILQDVFHTKRQKHSIVDNITKEKVCQFAKSFFDSGLFMQTLVQGNVTQEDAVQLYRTARKHGSVQTGSSKVRYTRCNAVKEGSKYVQIQTFNAKDSNTVVTNYYQEGPGTLQNLVYLEIGCMLMSEPCFDTLRTKEQLGYDVFSMIRNTFGIIGVSITVNSQATKFTAEHVDERIEAFVDWFTLTKLAELSDEEFAQIVTTLIKGKKTADVTLEEEVNRNWNEIVSGEYFFNRFAREVELLETCSKTDMVKYVNGFLARNEKRKKLSIQVIGNADAMKEASACDVSNDRPTNGDATVGDDDNKIFTLTYVDSSAQDKIAQENLVRNVEDFKLSLTTYPVLHIVE